MTAPARRHALAALVVILLPLLVLSRLTTAGWTWWDDPDTIHHNPRLNPPTLSNVAHYWTAAGPNAPMGLYIPVTYTAWTGLAAVAPQPPDVDGIRLNPHVFHTADLLLHALSAWLVFELLRTLLGDNVPAALGALLFALHPVQVEPVAWISGGKDLLCGCFSLAAIWQLLLWSDRRTAVRYALATLLFCLALLSKPTAVVVPFMAAVICSGPLSLRERVRVMSSEEAFSPRPKHPHPNPLPEGEGTRGKTLVAALIPWLLLALATAAVARWSQPADWGSPLPIRDRPGIAADALAHQLLKFVHPFNLAPDEGRRPATVVARGWIDYAWVFPVAVAALLLIRPRRWRVGWVAGLLFLLPLLPVLGLVPFQFQYVSTSADHYLYLAMLGPALLLAAIVRTSRLATPLAIAVLAMLSALSIQQAALWQTNRTLFEHTLAVTPASFIACDMLGYDHTLEANHLLQAARNDPARAATWASRAHDQLDLAIAYFRRGLSINPDYVPSLLNLAIDSQRLGRRADARAAVDQIAAIQPVLPPEFRAEPVDLARTLYTFGDAPAAARVLRRWLAIHPADLPARQLLAQAAATRAVMR